MLKSAGESTPPVLSVCFLDGVFWNRVYAWRPVR